MRKIRTNYTFTEGQHTLLTQVAHRMQISVSELLRRIIDEWRLDMEKGNERGAAYTLESSPGK